MSLCGELIIHNEYIKIQEKVNSNELMKFNESTLMFEYPNQIFINTDDRTAVKQRESSTIINSSKASKKLSNRNIILNQSSSDNNKTLDNNMKWDTDPKQTVALFNKSEYNYGKAAIHIRSKKSDLKSRKITLRSIDRESSPNETSTNITHKILNNTEHRPLSLNDKSYESISDYSLPNKVKLKSPDKLRILKSTIRTTLICKK